MRKTRSIYFVLPKRIFFLVNVTRNQFEQKMRKQIHELNSILLYLLRIIFFSSLELNLLYRMPTVYKTYVENSLFCYSISPSFYGLSKQQQSMRETENRMFSYKTFYHYYAIVFHIFVVVSSFFMLFFICYQRQTMIVVVFSIFFLLVRHFLKENEWRKD